MGRILHQRTMTERSCRTLMNHIAHIGGQIVISVGCISLFLTRLEVPFIGLMKTAYVCCAMFTFAFLLTAGFRNCCADDRRFLDHLRHYRLPVMIEDVYYSLIWPWGWYRLDLTLREWDWSLFREVVMTIWYWQGSIVNNAMFDIIDVSSGVRKPSHLWGPVETCSAIRKMRSDRIKSKQQ